MSAAEVAGTVAASALAMGMATLASTGPKLGGEAEAAAQLMAVTLMPDGTLQVAPTPENCTREPSQFPNKALGRAARGCLDHC
jgi:hypothetical protein